MGFAGFNFDPYRGSMVIPPSAVQMQAAQSLLGFRTPVNVQGAHQAARSRLKGDISDYLLPEMQEHFGASGYGVDTNVLARESSRELTGRFRELEEAFGMEEVRQEQALRDRWLQAMGMLPNYLAAADPMQAYQQQLEEAQYGEYISQTRPGMLPTYLGLGFTDPFEFRKSTAGSTVGASGVANFGFSTPGGGDTGTG